MRAEPQHSSTSESGPGCLTNVLIPGGQTDSNNQILNQILVFDAAQSTWKGGFPPMKYERYQHAVGLLPNVSRFCP